jgi:hypothetical protein
MRRPRNRRRWEVANDVAAGVYVRIDRKLAGVSTDMGNLSRIGARAYCVPMPRTTRSALWAVFAMSSALR